MNHLISPDTYVCSVEPVVSAHTQQSQVVEVVWDDPVAR